MLPESREVFVQITTNLLNKEVRQFDQALEIFRPIQLVGNKAICYEKNKTLWSRTIINRVLFANSKKNVFFIYTVAY